MFIKQKTAGQLPEQPAQPIKQLVPTYSSCTTLYREKYSILQKKIIS